MHLESLERRISCIRSGVLRSTSRAGTRHSRSSQEKPTSGFCKAYLFNKQTLDLALPLNTS